MELIWMLGSVYNQTGCFLSTGLGQWLPRNHKHLIPSLKYNFGKENGTMNCQSLALFQLNYFISLCISGKYFCKLRSSELVYQSNRETISHILSIDRIKKLITISGICGVSFKEHSFKFSASTKVHAQSIRQEMIGFVLGCNRNTIKVHITHNNIMLCASSNVKK